MRPQTPTVPEPAEASVAAAPRGRALPLLLAMAALLLGACTPPAQPDGAVAAVGAAAEQHGRGRGPSTPTLPLPAPPAAEDVPRRSNATAGAVGAHSRRLLDGFLLNGLLVPLLEVEDASGPRWTDPALLADCGLPSQASIDGGPVPVGQALLGRAFTLRWHLFGCRPFGAGGIELTGTVELLILPENDGLSAVVQARELSVTDPGGGEHTLAAERYVTRARWTL